MTMTPHVMIWPLPVDPQIAELPETYHVSDPPHQWIMAAGTPVAHMHVHFSEATASALRQIPAPTNEDESE